MYVAKDGQYLGAILIADTVRDDAKEVIKELKAQGAKTVMLTGDNEKYARAVAEEVGIDDFKFGLLPADKVVEMEAIMENKGKKTRSCTSATASTTLPYLCAQTSAFRWAA